MLQLKQLLQLKKYKKLCIEEWNLSFNERSIIPAVVYLCRPVPVGFHGSLMADDDQ